MPTHDSTTSAPQTRPDAAQLALSPFYHSAVNAVTRPNQATWCSDYFLDRWMPLLGAEGTRIVLALRRRGYNNRRTGVKRDEIVVSRAELAALVGCSEDTLSRQLGCDRATGKPNNPWLHFFVRAFRHQRRDAGGRLWQEKNGYWVAMDDPLHPDDRPLVEAYIRDQEAQAARRAVPETQIAAPVRAPETQTAEPETHSAAPKTQTAAPKPQNASRYKDKDYDSRRLEKTLLTPAAPEGSPAAGRSEDPEKRTDPGRPTVAASREALARADTPFALAYRAMQAGKARSPAPAAPVWIGGRGGSGRGAWSGGRAAPAG